LLVVTDGNPVREIEAAEQRRGGAIRGVTAKRTPQGPQIPEV
jgi:hypothetical protein